MSEKLMGQLLISSQEIGLRLLAAIVVYLVGRFIIKRFLVIVSNWKPLQKKDATVAAFVYEVLHIGLNIILFLSVIGILGIPMASMVTLFASIGLAISMALQGSLGNLASGIMLLLFRPYDVGNTIKMDDYVGVVREIGLFYTTIVAFENHRISIPNSRMMNTPIQNFSREKSRRLDVRVYTHPNEDVAKTLQVLKQAIPNDERILFSPEEPQVYLSAVNKDSLEYIIQLWVKTRNYLPLKIASQELYTKALQAAGIDTPKQFIDSDKK